MSENKSSKVKFEPNSNKKDENKKNDTSSSNEKNQFENIKTFDELTWQEKADIVQSFYDNVDHWR